MVIRFAAHDDLQGIMELYQILVPHDLPIEPESLKTTWQDIMRAPENYRYIVAEENGRILSTCNMVIVPNLTRSSRPFAVIENVVTHPDARRRGLGRQTMQMALDYAKAMNCYKVMLLSGSHRKEAHAFYESLGFDGDKKKGFVVEYLDKE